MRFPVFLFKNSDGTASMKRFFVLLLLVLSGLNLFAVDVNSPAPLVVATYNIHHGEGADSQIDLERIARVIQALKPHIVCLQEVDRGLPRTNNIDMPAVFAELLDMTVIFEPNYRFAGGDYGNATFTSLPIRASRNLTLPNPTNAEPRGCLIVTVEWHGRQVDVMNTHLGLNGQERLAQAEAIVAEFGDNPIILAGDMNEHVTAPGMQRITWQLIDTITKTDNTIRGTVPVNNPMRRIDYIFVSSAFETLSSEIIYNDATRVASDHLPYKASLRLKPGENE